MKPNFILNIAIITVLALAGWSCSQYYKKAQGNEIAGKIESFRKEKGRLPESLSEIGIEEREEGPIYYRKKEVGKYILWYGAELGESVTYDSGTKSWR